MLLCGVLALITSTKVLIFSLFRILYVYIVGNITCTRLCVLKNAKENKILNISVK